MAAPQFTQAQMQDAFLALLPSGRAWPKTRDSNLTRTVGGLVPSAVRVTERARALVTDILPLTTNELLAEWEASLGLPDDCQGIAPSTEARRAQVVARFIAVGGQSIADLTSYAARLGYAITITEFAPTRAGLMRAGQPLYGDGIQHTLRVDGPASSARRFQAGASAAGDPLSTAGNAVLECELAAISPAHTRLVHTYSGVPPILAPGSITGISIV